MTNKQAVNILLNEQKCISRNDGTQCDRKCESCDLVMDAEPIREAYNMAISALQALDKIYAFIMKSEASETTDGILKIFDAFEAQDVPDINVGTSKYTVSATAVEEMLKDLLPERGMWEIEGDEAKNAVCEVMK